MTLNWRMGPGGEFDRIRRIVDALGENARSIGDDASVLDIPVGHKLVVSTDTSVDGVHFRRDWLTYEEMGYRATAAALSDLAAMAAAPLGVLLAIALPFDDADLLEQVARGAGAAVRNSGTVIIGGDLSTSATLTITLSVLGSALKPLMRSGARDGDSLYVTGRLGGSALGLAAFLRNELPPPEQRKRFCRPEPRIREALWLAERGAAACIDISDGIVGDLGHMAAASSVNLIVNVESIPLFEGASLDTALSSGEEYELCVTASQEIDRAGFAREFGIPLTLVGRVEASSSPVVIFQRAGESIDPPRSFTHFSA